MEFKKKRGIKDFINIIFILQQDVTKKGHPIFLFLELFSTIEIF
jgi:hypothetical protein